MMNNDQIKSQWANPGAVGLWALGIVLMVLWADLIGLIDSKSAPIILGWIFVAGIAQTLCGIIELRNGSLLTGNMLTAFGLFFMFGLSICQTLSLYVPVWFLQKVGAAPSTLLGIVVCYLAVMLIFFLPLLARGPSLLFWTILVAIPVIFGLGLLDIGIIGKGFQTILGWIIFILALDVLYLGGAELINMGLQKHVMPMGKPLIGISRQSHSESYHA